jgi:signal transduction histidine kinase
VLGSILGAAEARGLGPDIICRGLGCTFDHLRNKEERVDWRAFCRLIANLRPHFSPADFEEIGRHNIRSPLFRAVWIIARLLFTPMEVYLWMFDPRQSTLRSLFSCIRFSAQARGAGFVRLRLEIDEGLEPCPEFFMITKGSVAQVPWFFGLKEADITLTVDARTATFDITVPLYRGLFVRLRRAVMRPFLAKSVARELKTANEDLQRRNFELDDARVLLSRQATRLQTVQSIGRIVHSGLDLDATLQGLVEALVNVAGFAAASVALSVEVEGQRIERRAIHGTIDLQRSVEAPLITRRQQSGVLRMTLREGSDAGECRKLLDDLEPVVNMAVDNALTFTAVLDYRKNLEARVADRTAELARARDELSHSVIELQAAQQVRQRLFANINHEIRTPLALVTLVVGQLRSDCEHRGDDGALQKLESINANIRRLLSLIDGLLLLAAGQEGALKLRPQRVEIVALLRQLVVAWRPHAESQGLTLAYQGPDSLVAEVDPQAFERMVANLLSNAAKFTAAGGRITVRLEAAEAHQFAIVVSDTGIGVPAELKPRLFDRFVQGETPARDGQRGSGLGLSIVKELAVAHGGVVGLGDNPGGGARFHFVLPRSQRPATAAVGEGPAPTEIALSPPTTVDRELPSILEASGVAEATILVAEDDPTLLRATGEVLRQRYRVLLASNGLSALALSEAHRPDLLVTDVQMPEMDGMELTRRFRKASGHRLAPVIIITAFGELGTRLWGFEAGAVDFVSKPFEPEELLARIRSQLSLRRLALQLHETEKLAAIGTLTAGLAHELRNPANVVANAIVPLRRQLPQELLANGHPVGRLLELVEQNAQQMARLSRDLLGFGPGGETPSREELVLDLVLGALRHASGALAGRVVVQRLEYDGRIICNRPLVVQVLTNLLENAAQATGPDGEIEVSGRATPGYLVFEVADNGPGVPPELLERIFEPFFTTKPFGKGTGLGLAMARIYVDRHRGRLSVTNGRRGAVFRVELPWKAGAEVAVDNPIRASRGEKEPS